MTIFVGNKLTFRLERSTPSGFEIIGSNVEIVRREFNAEDFNGVGYQRVLINETYGSVATHGIGNNGLQTSLQVESVALALPMYRFDFAFSLDNQKLKELYEIYLRLYNARAQGNNVRLRMIDDRLYISEPIDVDGNERAGDQIGTVAEINEQANYSYKLKKVEYLIAWENFEWEHLVGDIYKVNIIGTELEIESDRNTGNQCFPAGEEQINAFEGLDVTEIPLPTDLTDTANTYDSFGVGRTLATVSPLYFGHFQRTLPSSDVENYFVSWDELSPGVNGEVSVIFENQFPVNFALDTGPTNTKILADTIPFITEDKTATTLHLREFRPGDTATFSNFRETNTMPLLLHGFRTQVDTWQNFIPSFTTDFEIGCWLIPHEIKPVETPIETTVNSIDVEQWEWGSTDSQFRPTFGQFTQNELGKLAFLNGLAKVENNATAGLPTLFSPPRPLSINLTQNGETDGNWMFGYQLNISATTNIELSFEMRMIRAASQITGGHGIAFILHNDPRGVNARGGGGPNIGFGGWDGATYIPSVAITPSIAIVFDPHGDGAAYDEPATEGNTPHHIRVVKDGRMNAAGTLFQSTSGFNFNGNGFIVKITINGLLSRLTVQLDPIAGGPSETYIYNGINIANEIGSDKVYLGFTGATAPGKVQDHYIDRFQLQHNSTWFLDDTERSGELYQYFKPDGEILYRNRTPYFQTFTTNAQSRHVSLHSPAEGDDVFYHVFFSYDDPLFSIVYKTIGPDPFSLSRELITQDSTGNTPVFTRGIQSPLNVKKFYLTQGSDSGNVYTTEDFLTYTLIGSWGEKDASLENEGQLYWYRNQYIARSPDRFLIDIVGDDFVDIRDLFCASSLGGTADFDLFDASREIISVTATPPYLSDYADTNEEQLIVVSRNISDKKELKAYALKAAEFCPI